MVMSVWRVCVCGGGGGVGGIMKLTIGCSVCFETV